MNNLLFLLLFSGTVIGPHSKKAIQINNKKCTLGHKDLGINSK